MPCRPLPGSWKQAVSPRRRESCIIAPGTHRWYKVNEDPVLGRGSACQSESHPLLPRSCMPDNDEVVEFGPFRLHVAGRLLQRNGVTVKLGSRSLDLLIALVERAGDVLSRRELIARAWSEIGRASCRGG